jgi:hypothetical protein
MLLTLNFDQRWKHTQSKKQMPEKKVNIFQIENTVATPYYSFCSWGSSRVGLKHSSLYLDFSVRGSRSGIWILDDFFPNPGSTPRPKI